VQFDHQGGDVLFDIENNIGVAFYNAGEWRHKVSWTRTVWNQAEVTNAFAGGFYIEMSRNAAGIVRFKFLKNNGTVVGDWQTTDPYTYTKNQRLFTIFSDRSNPTEWHKGTLFSGSPNLTWQQFAALP